MKEVIVFEARETWDKGTQKDLKESDIPWAGRCPLCLYFRCASLIHPFVWEAVPSPLLVTLIHSYALSLLRNVLKHIDKFRIFLAAHVNRKASVKVGLDELDAVLDHSPVDVVKLAQVLGEVVPVTPKKGQGTFLLLRLSSTLS